METCLKIYPTPEQCLGTPAFGKTVEFGPRALNDPDLIIAPSEYSFHHRFRLRTNTCRVKEIDNKSFSVTGMWLILLPGRLMCN